MNIVKPNTITTLVLNPSWLPHDWCSAGNAMRLLTKGAVRGFDANGALAGWEPAVKAGYPLSWRDQTIAKFSDNPCLRSGGLHEVHHWAIPTIVLIRPQPEHLHIQRETISPNSVKGVYNLYNGRCVWCDKKIPLSDASRDHYFPQDKGGPNELSNMVLSCKPCNSAKGNQFPYYDKNGEEPKIRFPMVGNIRIPFHVKPRPEWARFRYNANI